jgi:hypothetical protein
MPSLVLAPGKMCLHIMHTSFFASPLLGKQERGATNTVLYKNHHFSKIHAHHPHHHHQKPPYHTQKVNLAFHRKSIMTMNHITIYTTQTKCIVPNAIAVLNCLPGFGFLNGIFRRPNRELLNCNRFLCFPCHVVIVVSSSSSCGKQVFNLFRQLSP